MKKDINLTRIHSLRFILNNDYQKKLFLIQKKIYSRSYIIRKTVTLFLKKNNPKLYYLWVKCSKDYRLSKNYIPWIPSNKPKSFEMNVNDLEMKIITKTNKSLFNLVIEGINIITNKDGIQ